MTWQDTLTTVVAQSTPDPSRYADGFTSGEFFQTIVDVFADKLTLPILALLVFGSIGMSYYQVQRSPIIPIIMLVLIGGVTIAAAPGSIGVAVVLLFVLGMAGIGWSFYQAASS